MSLGKVQTAQRRHKAARTKAKQTATDLRLAVLKTRKTHSVQQIADAMGVHRQRVYQIIGKGE